MNITDGQLAQIDETLLTSIRNITNTTYCNPITIDDAISIIEELVSEIEHKEDELSSLQNDIENNYELKNVDLYEEYGVSEKDFI